ncbi:MAG: PEP/pyruvate-binding domain-containing protein [Actinomycetota bacterium]
MQKNNNKNIALVFENISSKDVGIAGGKGASLGEMTQAGIPVPPGFVVLSSAFEKFLEETDLNVEIDSILHTVNHKEIHTVENASEKISALIMAAEMPKDIADEVQKFFKKLNTKYVAVRSSATAEDSSSAAWAGQLDSFLNTEKENLLKNIKRCWASLFTPRAIFYRFEKELHKTKISVAVVVQKMVQSEISGIAFSVHPITQDRNQIIIEAGFGLGEAIVSGQITPDSYVVEKQPIRIIDKNVQIQSRGLYRAEKGGNEWRNILKKQGGKQVLSDEEIIELSDIILNIEKHYNFPCDIEWAAEKRKFYVVQSRPITTISTSESQDDRTNFAEIIKEAGGEVFDIKKSQNYISVVSRRIVLPLRYLFALGYSHPSIYLSIYGFDTAHEPFYDSWKHVFVDRSAMQYERENMLGQLSRNPDYLDKIAKQCDDDAKTLLHYSQSIKSKNTAILSEEEIKKILQTTFDMMVRLSAYLLFPISIQGWLEENVKSELKKKVADEKQFDKLYSILATPSKQNTGYFEQLKINELAILYRKNKDTFAVKQDVDRYLLNFGSQGVKYGYGNLWTKEDVLERLSYLSTEKDLGDRFIRIKNLPKEHDRQVRKVLKEIEADSDFIKKVAWSRLYMYIRTLRTDVLSASFANMFPLFLEIGRRFKLPLEVVVECSPAELIDLNFPLISEIKKRSTANIVRGVKGHLYYKSGTEAKALSEKLSNQPHPTEAEEESIKKVKEIRGNIANKGKVSGIVKIVSDNSELGKISRGDILVTAMTTPDFVPAMEKAAAFVTDEGGLLCHAAIVSREMNKPCIIGTKNATQILKDGDIVEVDANIGVVKILK